MDLDECLMTAEEAMEKAVEYLSSELRGVRTGRASTGLVEFVKIEYYGSMTDLRQLAMISVPEPTQLLIKPFDATSLQTIVKALQTAGLGLNPMAEKNQIRLNLPALSGDRRNQLVANVKHMGEQAKVTIRNARRDANKHVDQAEKDKSLSLSEDTIKDAKDQVQTLVKQYEDKVEHLVQAKVKEIQEL